MILESPSARDRRVSDGARRPTSSSVLNSPPTLETSQRTQKRTQRPKGAGWSGLPGYSKMDLIAIISQRFAELERGCD